MVRYFSYIDNPEKYQYDKTKTIAHSGAEVDIYLSVNKSERYELIKEMRTLISDKDVIEFTQLFDYAADEWFDDWFPLLCDNSAYVIGQYIESNRHRERKIDW